MKMLRLGIRFQPARKTQNGEDQETLEKKQQHRTSRTQTILGPGKESLNEE